MPPIKRRREPSNIEQTGLGGARLTQKLVQVDAQTVGGIDKTLCEKSVHSSRLRAAHAIAR